MKNYIDQAKESYPSLSLLVLTGGECFTYGDSLAELIKYASTRHKMFVRIVTNAYWAPSTEKAIRRLSPYVEAGLNEINLSTGDDHLEFVPLTNIKNACLASVELGLSPLVNIETRSDRLFSVNNFLKDNHLRKLVLDKKVQVINGIWVSFKKEHNQQSKNPAHLTYPHTRCNNLFNSINIDPEHRMLACCGLTAKYTKFLDLGNLKKKSIKSLFNKQFEDFLKIWIFTEGPHKILRFISKYAHINPEEFENLHDCQVCAIIFNNDTCQTILKEHYKEIYSNVILKYQAIKNSTPLPAEANKQLLPL